MSLLGLLATGAAAPPEPPDPPTGLRARIEATLDPATRTYVYTVGTDAPTIAGCLALADAAAGATSGADVPLVLVPPGTYAENIVRLPRTLKPVDVASTTLDPADVTIDPGTGTTDDTWEHYGAPGIIAGITLVGRASYSAVHCGDGFPPTGQVSEFIYYKVHGRQAGTGNAAFSWGIGPGQHVWSIDSTWTGITGQPSFYAHNFPAQPAPGILVVDGGALISQTPEHHDWAQARVLDESSGQSDLLAVTDVSVPQGVVSVGFLAPYDTPSWTGWIAPDIPANVPAAIPLARSLGTYPEPTRIP